MISVETGAKQAFGKASLWSWGEHSGAMGLLFSPEPSVSLSFSTFSGGAFCFLIKPPKVSGSDMRTCVMWPRMEVELKVCFLILPLLKIQCWGKFSEPDEDL